MPFDATSPFTEYNDLLKRAKQLEKPRRNEKVFSGSFPQPTEGDAEGSI